MSGREKTAARLSRCQKAQQLNRVIDRALISPSHQNQEQVLQLARLNVVRQLAERIRKRATLLSKRHISDTKQLLDARDQLTLSLYASIVPPGWACAWCDGSSMKRDSHRCAGIGGIVMNSSGTIIVRITRAMGDENAFTAELVALATVMRTALDHQLRRLWVYTDNCGLAQLWRERRNDIRLAEIRVLNTKLERFSLHEIPRLHNQSANALARLAARSVS